MGRSWPPRRSVNHPGTACCILSHSLPNFTLPECFDNFPRLVKLTRLHSYWLVPKPRSLPLVPAPDPGGYKRKPTNPGGPTDVGLLRTDKCRTAPHASAQSARRCHSPPLITVAMRHSCHQVNLKRPSVACCVLRALPGQPRLTRVLFLRHR